MDDENKAPDNEAGESEALDNNLSDGGREDDSDTSDLRTSGTPLRRSGQTKDSWQDRPRTDGQSPGPAFDPVTGDARGNEEEES